MNKMQTGRFKRILSIAFLASCLYFILMIVSIPPFQPTKDAPNREFHCYIAEFAPHSIGLRDEPKKHSPISYRPKKGLLVLCDESVLNHGKKRDPLWFYAQTIPDLSNAGEEGYIPVNEVVFPEPDKIQHIFTTQQSTRELIHLDPAISIEAEMKDINNDGLKEIITYYHVGKKPLNNAIISIYHVRNSTPQHLFSLQMYAGELSEYIIEYSSPPPFSIYAFQPYDGISPHGLRIFEWNGKSYQIRNPTLQEWLSSPKFLFSAYGYGFVFISFISAIVIVIIIIICIIDKRLPPH